jgi:hypothetical protein
MQASILVSWFQLGSLTVQGTPYRLTFNHLDVG